MGRMTIKYMNPLGDYDQKYGQRYWGKAHDVDMDVAFNMMNPVNFEDGDEIEYEKKEIKETGPKSKNPGTEYIFLTKVKRADSGSDAEEVSSVSTPTTKEPSSTPPAAKAAAEPLAYEAGTNARWALREANAMYKAVVGGMPDSKQDYDQIMRFAKWLITAYAELRSGNVEVEEESGNGLERAREMAAKIKARSGGVEDVTGKPGYEDPFEGMDLNDIPADESE